MTQREKSSIIELQRLLLKDDSHEPLQTFYHKRTRKDTIFSCTKKKTISFIAKELQRDKSSVSREIKRNTNTEGIYSHHTHKSNMKFEDANVVENHCY